MHFLYFAQKKIEPFYDFLVERTEESTTKVRLRETKGKVATKGKGSFGSILAALGLASVDIEAEVSASEKQSLSREVISQFTPAQKLKALLLMLHENGLLSDLNDLLAIGSVPTPGSRCVFVVPLKTNTDAVPEAEIERTRAAVLTGRIDGFAVTIQASLQYMESDNAWRRLLNTPVPIVGFGTVMTSSLTTRSAEIDPIFLGYWWGSP